MRRICVTGPESTWKTSLARKLAEPLGAECVPEAARLYAERVERELTVADVEPIARLHLELADAAERRTADRHGSAIVLDTDLVSTIVYGRYYYDFSSPWIDSEAALRLADVYLLCDVDVPWVADGVRDRPTDRAEMLARFRDELSRRSANVVSVTGSWDARLAIALRASTDEH